MKSGYVLGVFTAVLEYWKRNEKYIMDENRY